MGRSIPRNATSRARALSRPVKALSMNTRLTDAAKAALKDVTPPWSDRPLSASGAEVSVAGDKATVVIETPREAGPAAEDVRLAAEAAVRAVSGIAEARAILTAHQSPASGGHAPLPTGRGAPKGPITLPGVKRVVAVASGKGGVGKSTVAANLAAGLARRGRRVGFLDADIYGPSAPTLFNLEGPPEIREEKIQPLAAFGVKVLSIGFMIEPEKALIWRGPMVMGAVSQLLGDADWGELDALIIDTPPGTGDAHLTLAQRAPLSGVLLVTTPQDLAYADARRSGKMFRRLSVPILGVVENMAFLQGPGGSLVRPFGEGGGARLAAEFEAPLIASLPLDPALQKSGDDGAPLLAGDEDAPSRDALERVVDALEVFLEG